MDAESVLKALAGADTGITGLIADRFYPQIIPHTAVLPAAAYQITGADIDIAHDGPAGVNTYDVLLTISAASSPSARSVADAFSAAWNGYKGTLAGEKVAHLILDNEQNSYAEQATAYVMRQDYSLMLVETEV